MIYTRLKQSGWFWNRKLSTLALSVAFLNRRDKISLLLLSVHIKDLWDAHLKDVKNARQMARVKGFEIQIRILFMNSS